MERALLHSLPAGQPARSPYLQLMVISITWLAQMMTGVGRILIRCHRCKSIIYRYAIGDKADKNKFNGPPVPKRALSYYDDFTCPFCGARLSEVPRSVRYMSSSLFEKLYIEEGYKLLSAAEVGGAAGSVSASTLGASRRTSEDEGLAEDL